MKKGQQRGGNRGRTLVTFLLSSAGRPPHGWQIEGGELVRREPLFSRPIRGFLERKGKNGRGEMGGKNCFGRFSFSIPKSGGESHEEEKAQAAKQLPVKKDFGKRGNKEDRKGWIPASVRPGVQFQKTYPPENL